MFIFSRALVATLAVFISFSGPAFAEEDIKGEDYKYEDYAQTKLPSISSCDPKAESSLDSIGSMGNATIDAITGTGLTLYNKYGKKEKSSETDSDDDVDGNATLDKDCPAEKKLGYDAEKFTCGQVKDADFITSLSEKRDDGRKALACQRGVLDAINGEISCFKKQISEAEKYMNELIAGPGGLADMLKDGNEQVTKIDGEIQDRESQAKAANERIQGGEGGNPPGLLAAKTALTKLSAELPETLAKVNAQVENLRNQQSRFNSLVDQLPMARAMECMRTPMKGYSCVKKGSTSAKYPSGDVSPLDYVKCIYAQSANKVVGGTVVKNTTRETAYFANAEAAFKRATDKTPAKTDLPDFSDKGAFTASMKVYPVTNPADLIKLIGPNLSEMDAATGKKVSAQFQSDLNRCHAAAKREVAKERTDANSQIKASEVAMKQGFEASRAANAKEFRNLRDSYIQTVKAATGQAIKVDTSQCEQSSLEDQAKCFDAFNAMNDSLLTGKVVAPSGKLTGPAAALTAGNNPIFRFGSSLVAKGVPQRTIKIECTGIDDCLTQYTNHRTKLTALVEERKAFKETYKTNVNTRLQAIAADLASKGTTGGGQAGVQASGITLNRLSGDIAARKALLEKAMTKLGVGAGIDLDPKEVKTPSTEKGEMFKSADLKDLVLASIAPGLPDVNSKGFGDASKSLKERDDELEKKQDELDKVVAAAEAKKGECAKDLKKLARDAAKEVCDKDTATMNACIAASGKDAASTLIADLAAINVFTTKEERDRAMKLVEEKHAGEKKGTNGSATTPINCSISQEQVDSKCSEWEKLVNNLIKGAEGTGGKNKKSSDDAEAGN